MQHAWTCSCCGKQHDELPLDVGLLAPDPWLDLTEAERKVRGTLDRDVCTLDTHNFVKGCLEVPIIDSGDMFVWGMWVSVSDKSFATILNLWNAEIPDDQPPLFAWLCNNIGGYPQTFGLKTNLHLRNNGRRPFIKLEPTEHPLAREQRDGITLKRVEEIISAVLPHH
jgi:hypothetical protein